MIVYRNRVNVGTLSGPSVTVQTCAGDGIFVAPPGTSYASIASQANAQ